eukprot:544641-Pyramimonas_sp.AAC.1
MPVYLLVRRENIRAPSACVSDCLSCMPQVTPGHSPTLCLVRNATLAVACTTVAGISILLMSFRNVMLSPRAMRSPDPLLTPS